jgi:hypothetical protein
VQERYSHRRYLTDGGVGDSEMLEALEPYDDLMESLRKGATYEDIRKQLKSKRLPALYRNAS